MGNAIFLQMGALTPQTEEAMTLIFCVSLLVLGLGVLAAWRLYLPWFTWNRASGKGLDPADCSLMIVGRNDPEGFEQWIHKAYKQLPQAEIIAIDNQSEDETANVLEALKRQYPDLIVVTLPSSERFWGTRKLALTLAVKAAHRSYSLWVDSRCEIPSDLASWQKALTDPLRRGKAIASFAPVMAERSASYGAKAESLGVNVWAHLRARPLFPGVKRAATTGIVPVNFAFETSKFFEIKGYLSSMHLNGGEAEFLLNDLAEIGPVVAVTQTAAYLRRPWLPQNDSSMRAHRSPMERWALARYTLLLALIDLVAAAAVLHMGLLWIHMDNFNMIQPSPQIRFVLSQIQAILGVYILMQLSFMAYLFQWAKRMDAGQWVGLSIGFYLRFRLLKKAFTFLKK